MCQVCAHVCVVVLTFFLHQFAVDYDCAGKDSVHHIKGQCPSYQRTVSIISKDSVHHIKGQWPSYQRTVAIYERTVAIIWKDSVHHMKEYLVALVGIFS
jgi:hypothetical protein